MTRAFAENRLVLADTYADEVPTTIDGHHACPVFGFDARTDMPTLRNPHANDFEPKGAKGFENGFRRKDGVLSMPLPLFERAFQYAMIEQFPKAR